MADKWLDLFPLACRSLLGETLECQDGLNEAMEEITPHFTWLDEIVTETCAMFAIKRKNLQQMPKTPCQKLPRKLRKRKMETVDEDKENSEVLVVPKAIPTKLKFEIDCHDSVAENITKTADDITSDVKTEIVAAKGRPLRSCRIGANPVYADESPKTEIVAAKGRPLRSCRVGANPVYADESPKTKRQSRQPLTKNALPVKKQEISPSVRDRASAYESMIKQSTSKSPIKTSHPGTSGNVGKVTPVGVKNDNSKKSIVDRNSALQGLNLKNSPTPARENYHADQKENISKTITEVVEPKQCRTRLRLKKNKEPEEEVTRTETDLVHADNVKKYLHVKQSPKQETIPASLNETQIVVTEVFEIQSNDKPARLKEFEMTKVKTTPVLVQSHIKNAVSDCRSENLTKSMMVCDNDSQDEHFREPINHKKAILDETQIVVTEVYELFDSKTEPVRLKEFEMVKVKTTPINDIVPSQAHNPLTKNNIDPTCSSSDQGFNDEDEESSCESDGAKLYGKSDETFSKDESNADSETGRTTRTRTRAQQEKQKATRLTSAAKSSKDSGVDAGNVEACMNLNSTFTRDEGASSELEGRTTRTRAQLLKESREASMESTGPSTRTRQAKQAAESVSKASLPANADKNAKDSRSPRPGKKRPVEERGLSPCPKRSRSYGIKNHLPLTTSSPKKNKGIGTSLASRISRDALMSPRRSPRAFKFNSAQRKPSGFLNRTPGFSMNTSRLYSFLNTTPNCSSNNTVVTSFLKRNTPPTKQNIHAIQEQKKSRMIEKENRDKERLKKAAELKQRRIEELKRQREEKERRVAEVREQKNRIEQEQKDKMTKKFEDQYLQTEKLLEARLKEEKEKQKLRLKKQMEADARRKQEEEERQKRFLEQEKERLKRQEEEAKRLAEQEALKQEFQKMINKHNSSITHSKPPPPASANVPQQSSTSNNNKQPMKSSTSYDMTPVKVKSYAPMKDPDNYDIDDKESDESTDDEEAPKKLIPSWALGISLNTALIRQFTNPPDLDAIFRIDCIEPPDLEKVFAGTKKRRYKERTSSAIWKSPVGAH